MCTIRCLVLGVRLVRNGISCSISTRPQISSYVTSGFFNHTNASHHIFKRVLSSKVSNTAKCSKWQASSECPDYYSTKTGTPSTGEEEEQPKLSLFQRYKKMLKEYWYVLIPVHCATSAIWLGSFYYAATCGVDIVPVLEYLGVNEEWIKPLRSSSLGYLAVATAFYKLASPARYAVTVGSTTVAIRILTDRGLIKPMPSKAKMKEMVKQKRDHLMSRKTEQH